MRRPPSSFVIALLLHLLCDIVFFFSLADARGLNSPEPTNYNTPSNGMLDDIDELSYKETPMGSFSQLPLQQQQQQQPPPPPCVEPPFTLPSPPSQQLSPPILPGIPAQSPPLTPSPPKPQPGPPTPIQSPPNPQPGPPSLPGIPAQSPPLIPSPPKPQPGPPTPIQSPPNPQPGPPTLPSTPPAHNNPPAPSSPFCTPPPSQTKPGSAVWCVSKPSVSDAILQRALDYACGTGGDCKPIQPGGPCFQPNTVSAHSSFAFNSYWQKAKVAGGTCDFGGTAMLVSTDPSYNGCHFASG